MSKQRFIVVVGLWAWLMSIPAVLAWTTSAPIVAGTQDRSSARITLDGTGKAYVTWHEKVGSYYQCFYTSGTSGAFATPAMISQGTSLHHYGPVSVVDSAGVHVVWSSDENQNNNFEIWYRRLSGGVWGPILNATNTSIKSLGQAIASRSPLGPIVCWQEALWADDNYDVMFSEWTGNGFSGAFNVSNTPGGSVYGSVAPAAVIAPNGDVTVVWPDRISGSYHMNARRRVNGVWAARQEISTKPTGPGAASIGVDNDGQVHIAYTADPADGVSNITVWYQKWNGSTWTEPLDVSRGFSNLWRCAMAVDNQGFVHVVADNAQSNPQGEIWYTTNRTGAWTAWQNISQTSTRSSSPLIAYGGGQIYVLWSDDGNGSGGASGFNNFWHTRTSLQPTGPAGTITGTVRDQYGVLVSNATITSTPYEIASLSNGTYSLLVPAGTQTVSCNKPGFVGQTVSNVVVGDGATVTANFMITGTAPAPVSFTATSGNMANTLSWTNPISSNCSGTQVRFKSTGVPQNPTDGTLLIDQPGSSGTTGSFEHSGLTNGIPCYYAAFAYFRDASTYYASGATATASPAGPGDMDHDGDVDQTDFGLFQDCFSGPFVRQADASCRDALLDGDTDVDQDDADLFIGCMSGPGSYSNPSCIP